MQTVPRHASVAASSSRRRFPAMTSRGFSEQENPELGKQSTADELDVWRSTSIGPDGDLRPTVLALGVVLSRRRSTGTQSIRSTITRSRACILEDIFTPIAAAQKRQSDKQTAVTEMVMDRVPDDAKRFQNQFLGGMKAALESATSTTNAALARAEAKSDEDDAPAEADDGVDA